MSITCDRFKFLDSLNFLPMPLSHLPKVFDFNETKGYFPHLFNTKINEGYAGKIPAINFYAPDEMTPIVRENFVKWYAEESSKNELFILKQQLIKYCIIDVDILRKACLKFWNSFKLENNVDPFVEATTIASACNAVFRKNFLKSKTIGLIPVQGYRMTDNQSLVGLKWLLWVTKDKNINIQHAGNGKEVYLTEKFSVDGFCRDSNTVYEFHGCYYHGCERCYPEQVQQFDENKKKSDMFLRRERTEAKSNKLRELKYNVVEMRECDFNIFLRDSIEAQDFLENHPILKNTPLNIRDSFFGGRTNAVKLYHKINPLEQEQIHYFDVCSLYPYVNKYCKYPIGHPKIHLGDSCKNLPLDSIEGIIKCTILPPKNLYHPLLPCRMHGKLMFVLCRTCGGDLAGTICTHNNTERMFTGTFVMDEVRKAIQLGYIVFEILEFWEYETVVYDKDAKSGGLFSEYINKFLKMKVESSGWPSWCIDNITRKHYIQNYEEKEGIVLEEENIQNNPGRRGLAKLMLNSFWGKFGQRENQSQHTVIEQPEALFRLLTDPSIKVESLTYLNDWKLLANWCRLREAALPLKTVNVAIATYTTAFARLELYKYIELLGTRTLYFDTDSVFFTHKPGEFIPNVGDYLGCMTNELDAYGPGSYITEFVSGGPKNYAYKVFSPTKNESYSICKVKGITLNYKSSQTVNFDALKNLVVYNALPESVETERKIARTKGFNVVSKPEKKIFRVTYTKRKRLENSFETLPYGFVE